MRGLLDLQQQRRYGLGHFGLMLAFIATFLSGWPGAAQADNDKYAAFVMDSNTTRVLFSRNADKLLHPASLTKMMTLLMTFEAIEHGKLYPGQRIRISRHAASMVPSKLGLSPGASIKVKNAIPVLVTKSANDVAVALAEAIAGSESRFAMQMTRKAHDIGMTRTRFRNASGLHHPQQVSTARDMARLGQYMIQQYPGYYDHFDRPRFRYEGKTYRNHNHMLSNYRGMDGIKTGYISAAGFNLVASVKRGDERLIGVVFGGRSAQSRNTHMRHILNRGFEQMNHMQLAANTPVPEPKPGQTQHIASRSGDVVPPDKPRGGSISVKARDAGDTLGKIANLRDFLSRERFAEMFGQGDYDAGRATRMRTGLMAIAAHTRTDGRAVDLDSYFHARRDADTPARQEQPDIMRPDAQARQKRGNWSIQLGAYLSRARTEDVLRRARARIKRQHNDQLNALIAPRRAPDDNGWLYRARFTGLSKSKARSACQLFNSCMTIAPAR